MKRRWFCVWLTVVLLLSALPATVPADSKNPQGYDVYLTAPHVASEDITVTLGDKQYLKYDVSISSFDSLLTDRIQGGIGTLCAYLFWAYDRLPLVYDNTALGVQTAYSNKVHAVTGAVRKNYQDPLSTNIKCQMPVVNSSRGFDTGYAYLLSTADFVHFENDLVFSLYFAIPDAPTGTVFYFDFCDVKWDPSNSYYNDACLIELFEGGTWEKQDITFGAYNGSITIGDTSIATYTAAPTDTPTPTARPNVTASPAGKPQTTATPTPVPPKTDAPTQQPNPSDSPTVTLSPCERNGHSFGTYETVIPSTCRAAGDSVAVCSVCGERKHAALPLDPNAHTVAEDPAIPATCTESGRTKGSHCAECGTLLTRQAVTGALGHDWKDGIVKDEQVLYTCARCFETKTEPVPKKVTLFSVEYWADGALFYTETVTEGAQLVTQPEVPPKADWLGRWSLALPTAPILENTTVNALYTRLGDVNEDTRIDRTDGQLALDAVSGKHPLSEWQFRLSDLNGDGLLLAREVAALLRKGL